MWLIFLLGTACLITAAVGAYSLAPWLPSFERDLTRVFALAALKKGERFYDLGSGDGRLVRYAARNFGALSQGIEIALPLYLWSVVVQAWQAIPGVSYRCRNLFGTNLSDADVVYIFGRPGKLGQRIAHKFTAELKPGTRVISYAFPLEGRTATHVDKPTSRDLSIYFYRF